MNWTVLTEVVVFATAFTTAGALISVLISSWLDQKRKPRIAASRLLAIEEELDDAQKLITEATKSKEDAVSQRAILERLTKIDTIVKTLEAALGADTPASIKNAGGDATDGHSRLNQS